MRWWRVVRACWVALGGIAAAGAFVLLAAAAAVFCEATLHVPRRIAEMPAEADRKGDWRPVSIRADDGARLEGWFVRPLVPRDRQCVMLLHGIGDSRAGVVGFAPMFLDEGYSVLLPDSRGHGSSQGAMVTYGLLEKFDVLHWTGWLKEQGCGGIYGLGESLGGSILILASGLKPAFRAIVAECPYADLAAIAEYRVEGMSHLPQFLAAPLSRLVVASGMVYGRLRFGLDFRQVLPVVAIARTTTPVLLIHGTADWRTPYWHSQRLAQADPRAALWLVPNAAHTAASQADPQGFRTRVLRWFAEH